MRGEFRQDGGHPRFGATGLYEARLERMKQGGNDTFKLEPEAVAEKLVHAVESQRPKKRYFVTKPTYFAAIVETCRPHGGSSTGSVQRM